jgi:hypothetical protein
MPENTQEPATESERYASEQSAPTEEETREAGEFKYPMA